MSARPIGVFALLALSLAAAPARAEPGAPAPTRSERNALDRLVAHLLERDFRLVPVRAKGGGWRVGLAVKGYAKHETADGGYAADPYWDTSRGEDVRSWTDLRIEVQAIDGFCGGEGRSFLVTISSRRSGSRVKEYGVHAGEDLARLRDMDVDTCME